VTEQVLLDEYEAGELSVEFEAEAPQELLSWALDKFQPRIALSIGGAAEGMAILDMAWRLRPDVRVFSLDTGRLPQETHDLIERIRQRYEIAVEVLFPEAAQVERMVQRNGTNLMYSSVDLRLLCCQVRKVLPLNRYLKELDAWITGIRREQWATRSNVRKIELDHDHAGIAKVNPLADWTKEEVWDYIRANEVPYNELYDKGFTSIGCAPCTRPIQPGESDRSGRWWWETDAPKECGIHCAIYTGGFEHELHALLGDHANGDGEVAQGNGEVTVTDATGDGPATTNGDGRR
jgi:phosphoadenosine phosphosulfate reductase